MQEAAARVSRRVRCQAYAAWIGYYANHLRALGWDKEQLVQRSARVLRL